MNYGFSYNGYQYFPMEDREPDNIKIFHDVISPTGERLHVDWSPYSTPTVEDFQLWVELGCPERIRHCSLNREDLETIKKNNA